MPTTDSIRIESSEAPWVSSDSAGAEHKHLAENGSAGGWDVSLARLAPGACLPRVPPGRGIEVVVIAGTWVLPEGTLSESGYTRRPPAHLGGDSSPSGCTLFVRSGPFAADDTELVFLDDEQHPWLPGQGGLRVKPLHAIGTEGTAFVHWPEGERFLPHRHFGGEEIFVLTGVFEDENGRYPAGTWLLSPHLSSHHPFVQEETVIYVKTGHLLGDQTAGS